MKQKQFPNYEALLKDIAEVQDLDLKTAGKNLRLRADAMLRSGEVSISLDNKKDQEQ